MLDPRTIASPPRSVPSCVRAARSNLWAVRLLVLALVAVPLGANSCLAKPASAGSPMLVYAGAGFRAPIEEAARVFRDRYPVELEMTFAGSGCLLAQAELAGRGDIFIPGEYHYLYQAQVRQLAGNAVPIAYLRPVLAVAKGNPKNIQGTADLGKPGVRVGLGDAQSVAVGLAAERWLAAHLTPAQLDRVHANVKTRAINVNELGSQLQLGAIDAVIVWDATLPLFNGLEMAPSAGSEEFRTVITGSVLTLSKQPERAGQFLEFLTSEEGERIFRSFGYEPYPQSEEFEPDMIAAAERVARLDDEPIGDKSLHKKPGTH